MVPVKSFRLRRVPGPPALPFFGNLLDVMKGSSPYYLACAAQYGPIFRVWFGRAPYVVVTSPELARAVGTLEERTQLRCILSTTHAELEQYGLTSARGAVWRTTRAAWQPAFHPASLGACFSLMDQAALKLVSHLSGLADAGAPVDIWRELGSMTMAVNGSIAYGVDFSTMKDSVGMSAMHLRKARSPFHRHSGGQPASSRCYGAKLLRACQVLFATSSLVKTSIYFKLNLLLPELNRLISLLAYVYPDKAFADNLQARSVLKRTSLELLRSCGTVSRAAGLTAGGTAGETSAAFNEHSVGVAADSFLGTLLSLRTAAGGGLSDAQVLAQAMTFLLAGYATTASALAFTIHSIASNPEVQERVLAEVDAFGKERDVHSNDMEQMQRTFPYIIATLKESMRLYPPAPAVMRVASVAVKLGGYHIPANTALVVSIYALHRNPAVWPEPERFLPERFLAADSPFHARAPGAHLPFGLGPRMCIGRHFAKREAIVTLVRLYQRYVFVLQPGQVPLALVNGFNSDNTLTLAPKHGVRVKVQHRERRM